MRTLFVHFSSAFYSIIPDIPIRRKSDLVLHPVSAPAVRRVAGSVYTPVTAPQPTPEPPSDGDDSTPVALIPGEVRRLTEQRSSLVTSSPFVHQWGHCGEAPHFWQPSFWTGTFPPQTLSRRTTCVRSFWSYASTTESILVYTCGTLCSGQRESLWPRPPPSLQTAVLILATQVDVLPSGLQKPAPAASETASVSAFLFGDVWLRSAPE